MIPRAQKETGVHDIQALARRFVEGLFDPTEAIDDVVAPQLALHSWPWTRAGTAGLHEARQALTRSWASQVVDVHETLQAGDHVILRVTEHGVHSGPWQGIEPTDRPVAGRAIHIVRVIDNQVVEHWRESDDLTRLHQLDNDMPPPMNHKPGEQ